MATPQDQRVQSAQVINQRAVSVQLGNELWAVGIMVIPNHSKSSKMLGNELWAVGIMVIPTPVIPNHHKSQIIPNVG